MSVLKLLSICGCMLTATVAIYGELQPAPLAFELARLNRFVEEFDNLPRGSKIPFGAFRTQVPQVREYRVSWERKDIPKANVERHLGFEEATRIALQFCASKLPRQLQPYDESPFIAERLILSTGEYVWILGFRIHDQSPIAGSGYASILALPVFDDSSCGMVITTP